MSELSGVTFIQPTNELVAFRKLDFTEAEIYLLTPQYKGGHGLEFYAVAIDKNTAEASFLQFKKGGQTYNSETYYSSEFPPVKLDETMIVKPGISAGTTEEEAKDITYMLDIKNKLFSSETPENKETSKNNAQSIKKVVELSFSAVPNNQQIQELMNINMSTVVKEQKVSGGTVYLYSKKDDTDNVYGAYETTENKYDLGIVEGLYEQMDNEILSID